MKKKYLGSLALLGCCALGGFVMPHPVQAGPDAIVGMNMAAKPADAQVQPSGGQSQPEVKADTKTADKVSQGSGIRLKWAEPKSED